VTQAQQCSISAAPFSSDWHSRIRRVAGGLAAAGLRRGDHLVVVMQNRWEMATLHWACQFLGVVVTPLNWRAKDDEVEYCVVDAKARAIAYEPASAEAVAGSAGCKSLLRIAACGASGGTLRFEELLEHAGALPEPVAGPEV
jgi:2-furoate---CoA ligase